MGNLICATGPAASAQELGSPFRLDSICSEHASGNHACLARCASFTHKATGPLVAAAFLDSSKRYPCTNRGSRKSSCRVAALLGPADMKVGRGAPAHRWRVTNDTDDTRRPAGYEWEDMAETVNKLCQQGHLNEAVEAVGVLVQTDCRISKSLFYTVVKKCIVQKGLVWGRRIHALTVKKGYDTDTFLCNHILRMYASHGRLQEAMDVFTVVAEPDVFMWSSIISAHVKHGQDKLAIQLYHHMRRSGVKPDGHVFVAALQACARGTDLETGQQVHADILASEVAPDMFVCNCLVDMYAKCGSLEDAERVFQRLSNKDVVTWTALIAGYSQQGMGLEALHLYSGMQEGGLTVPNSVTFVCLLQACASVGTRALETGKQLHAKIRERELEADGLIGNSLVNMYAKCGSLKDAQRTFDGLTQKDLVTWNVMIAAYANLGSLEHAQLVFDRLSQKNVVTWNVMITAYSQQGMGHEALRLYRTMREEGMVAPNSVTYVCLLQACANVAALHLGRQLHAEIEEQGLQAEDVLVAVSLINMYAKCGSMVDAQQVFEALPERAVVAWNALIAGYTRQGNKAQVFDLFHRMRADDIQPDNVTFLSVLTVCSHAGLVEQGRESFEIMTKHYGISPTAEHYTCMVDLLGRAGQLEEALALARKMPVIPDAAVWHNLLGACRKWSDIEVGRHAFNEAVNLDKKDATAYVMMSNVYASAQMWQQAQQLQARRKEIGAWKQPGQSWWTDMDGLVHSFLVGDTKHSESEGIYAMLDHLCTKLNWEGHGPQLDVLFGDVSDGGFVSEGFACV